MDVALPAFVRQLIDRARELDDVPKILAADTGGWLVPLMACLARMTEQGIPGPPTGAFLAHG
ncbi:hypothetical protein [Streptomyces sp. NPDC051644]|uniref:hypothetical protein n=1 Tax=unclassified Streptomyces TaxID=2593676 RepID=UPI0037B306E8